LNFHRAQDLAERARTNKLKPHEYQGGSFSISNLGMFGITEFAAVINPPQGCIMAIGGIKQRVTFDENTKKFTSRSTLTVTLSYDGRAISDHDMALWLEHFSHYLSDPQIMGV
jgi:pyruvate dehydrogenase E2 component (dihydrolipoamide acetyltransferase)